MSEARVRKTGCRPKGSMTVVAIVVVGGMAVFLGAISLEYRIRQDRIYSLAAHDPATAARRLLELFPPDGTVCAAENLSRDGAAILTALEAVEGFSTSPAERTAETVVAFSARLLSVEPPNLSYGPLQIRPSAVRRATNVSPKINSLMDACAARSIARQIIERKLNLSLGLETSLTRSQVLAIAALHNGQRPPERNAEHKLANRVYLEIVYHLFQQVRFSIAARPSA
jgi:hypothetical protein